MDKNSSALPIACFSTFLIFSIDVMADNGAPSAKRQKTAEIDANEAITFHFLDASKEPAAISEASTFSPDMCHQFFGDEEVGRASLMPRRPKMYLGLKD